MRMLFLFPNPHALGKLFLPRLPTGAVKIVILSVLGAASCANTTSIRVFRLIVVVLVPENYSAPGGQTNDVILNSLPVLVGC